MKLPQSNWSNLIITPKQIILIFLTIIIVIKIAFSLVNSWSQPQVQGQFDRYQTNIILDASTWQDPHQSGSNLLDLIGGKDALVNAENKYQQSKEEITNNIKLIKKKIDESNKQGNGEQTILLQKSLINAELSLSQINLQLGTLQAAQNKVAIALKTWQEVINLANNLLLSQTSQGLIELWQDPAKIDINLAQAIDRDLTGWFRYQNLKKLYQVQNQANLLNTLESGQKSRAESALFKLAFIGLSPVLFSICGIAILIVGITQLIFKQQTAGSDRSSNQPILFNNFQWDVPWNGETIWQVLLLSFFVISQLVLPLLFSIIIIISKIDLTSLSLRSSVIYEFIAYLFLALSGLGVLYLLIKPYFPLPNHWFSFNFKSNWFLWGVGSYLVAIPLVIIVSLINQLIWHGQGGSNPILSIALANRDNFALLILFLTAAIAAPIFEEFMFRGFLLASLTRYLPTWGAIIISGLIFAVAHLSLSEVLPLTTLGIILGFVYSKTQNLLAPIMLHSLWNSGTLITLFILGSNN